MTYAAIQPKSAAAFPVERRASPRRKTRFRATVVFGADRATTNCMVRNLSDTGACIKLDSPNDLPAQFHLIWAADRTVLSAEAVWRGNGEMGVRFLSKHDLQGRLSAELAAVCRAWEQHART